MMHDYMKYADDVVNGRLIVGEYQRLSVERHLKDLERAARGEIPYRFSENHAHHCLNFIGKLKHTKGRLARQRHNLELAPFQKFVWAVVFGWLGTHEDTGEEVRRFTDVHLEKARKGGKSTEIAAIGNYGLCSDGEVGAEIYSAATTMKQAKEVFNIAKSQLRKFKQDYKVLYKDFELLKENITYHPTESKYEPLPNEAERLDGSSPYYALFDEYHAYKDDSMIQILETGMGARDNPLSIKITTAGNNIKGPCYKSRKVAIDVLHGLITDERSFSMIYTMDEEDDWHNKELWVKPNPNIGVAPYWSYMNDRYNKALKGQSAEIQFKTKNLNIWTTTGSTWIKAKDWAASGNEFDWQECKGRPCWIGMDLSTSKDLTALMYYFPPVDGYEDHKVLCKFYCPEDNAEERSKSDKVPYVEWGKKGYMTLTAGPAVDYDYILKDLNESKQYFDIQVLEYDPALAYKLVSQINQMGIETSIYGQNTRDMNAPIMHIEELVSKREFNHGNHPVLAWNVSNAVMYMDTNGKVKFDKKKVVERIDGCVALAMAVGGYLTDGVPKKSKYETQDLGGV